MLQVRARNASPHVLDVPDHGRLRKLGVVLNRTRVGVRRAVPLCAAARDMWREGGVAAKSRRSRTSPVTHALPMHHQQNDACESATYALTRACVSRAGVTMAHRCHCRVVGATGRLPRRGGARAERHLLCVHDIRDAGGYPPSHLDAGGYTPHTPQRHLLCVHAAHDACRAPRMPSTTSRRRLRTRASPTPSARRRPRLCVHRSRRSTRGLRPRPHTRLPSAQAHT